MYLLKVGISLPGLDLKDDKTFLNWLFLLGTTLAIFGILLIYVRYRERESERKREMEREKERVRKRERQRERK